MLGKDAAFSALPAPVTTLLRSALASDPTERPASAREFLEDLRVAAEESCGSDWRRRAVIAPLVVAATVGAASAIGTTKAGAAIPSQAGTAATAGRGAAKATRLVRAHPLAAAGVVAAVVVAATLVGVASAKGGSGSPSQTAAEVTPVAKAATTTSLVPSTTSTPPTPTTSASGASFDGAYTISLPADDVACGSPSLSGEVLMVNGTSATLTPVDGGAPLTGSVSATGTTFTAHLTNGITDAPGAIVVDLSGSVQPDGSLSGQSQNGGVYPGGSNGFSCNGPFSATRSSSASSPGGAQAPTAPTGSSGSGSGSEAAASAAAAQWYAQGTILCAAHPPGQAPPASPTTIPASSIPVTWSQFTPGQGGSGQAGDSATAGPGQFTATYQNGTWSFTPLFNFC